VLGLINLVIVGSIWFVQRRFAASGQFVKLGGRASGARPIPLGAVKWPARTVALLYLACASLLPLAALVIVAFEPFWTPRIQASVLTLENFRTVLFKNDLTRTAFWNSIKLALAGATLATAITLVISIYTTRTKTLMARLVDGIVKAPATISALVISIGFLVTFSGPPFMLGGTLLLLLLAYVVIYMPSASIAVDAAVLQVGNDLIEASQISGAVDGRTVRKIILPLVVVGLTAGWSMVFVHIMGDLSASALLAAVGSPVVGYALLDVWESGSFTLLAAYATLICVAITVVVTGVTALARWYGRSR
jgi:iron(III) transport system permease protein